GAALNTIMSAIQTPIQNGVGPMIPLDPTILQRINVSGGTSTGNLGVLKDGGKLKWPMALRGQNFATEREQLNHLAPQAAKQAASGNVDTDTIQQMQDAVSKMNSAITSNIDSISMNDYTSAKQYMRQLESSIKSLSDADVANYASGRWAARGS